MTHEELLAGIDGQIRSNPMGVFFPYLLATRAVVQLHKPRQTSMGILCCEPCSEKIFLAYPCPTIQAIEKELK